MTGKGPKPVLLSELEADYKWFSEAVTKVVRSGSIGSIAAIWAVFTAEGIVVGEHGPFGIATDFLVRATFVCASLALLTDLLQYVSALWMTNIGIHRYEKRLRKENDPKFFYDVKNLGALGFALYWFNFGLFPTKVLLALCAGSAFVLTAFAILLQTGAK